MNWFKEKPMGDLGLTASFLPSHQFLGLPVFSKPGPLFFHQDNFLPAKADKQFKLPINNLSHLKTKLEQDIKAAKTPQEKKVLEEKLHMHYLKLEHQHNLIKLMVEQMEKSKQNIASNFR